MKRYDDITTINRHDLHSEEDAIEFMRATDLQEEAQEYFLDPNNPGPAEYLIAGAYNEEAVEVLYLPGPGRAGVAWGADSQWTDADSADDALERYFGVDGKEMVN